MTGRSQPSQCDRVLEILADGREHSVTEIHARAGTMRLNSRVAELRSKRGLTIVCHRGGGDYRYQLLVGPLAEPDPTIPSRPSTGGSGSGSPSGVGTDALPDVAPLQLVLEVAA